MCEGGNHHHDNRGGGSGNRFSSFFANWKTYDAPAHTKLYLALRNNWTKLRTFSDCCGNDGQPGC